MKKTTWATPLMILIALLVIITLAPFALLLAIANIRDAKELGINLRSIAQSIVSMSEAKSPTTKRIIG